MSTFVIFNPKARLGETGRRKTELRTLLESHVGEHVWLETEYPRHAEELATTSLTRGAKRIVVAGGDGTVSEVLTGLLAHEHARDVEVVPLPLGTGRDFARLLGLGTDLQSAVMRITSGRSRRVDVARVTCRDPQGEMRTRAFLNITSFGLTGDAALWLEEQARLGRRNKLSYTLSGFVGLSRYRAPNVTVSVDDKLVYEGTLSLGVAANGQYFAGGMRIAPRAEVDDGLLDIVLVPQRSLLSSVLMFPHIIRGTHVNDPKVLSLRGKKLEAVALGPVWVEADGEPVGTLPLTIEIVPGALLLSGLA